MNQEFEPSACCVPTKQALADRRCRVIQPVNRPRAPLRQFGTDWICLSGGEFRMGSDRHDAIPSDGEGPVRTVTIDPFIINRFAVTNLQFQSFVKHTGFVTVAEHLGSSFVFEAFTDGRAYVAAEQTSWWKLVPGACWKFPEGTGSSVLGKLNHPVVHVAYQDALAYSSWAGVRLPTEAEWEYASRGMQEGDYPWGNELSPNGVHFCNIWQGEFPTRNLGEDGFVGTAPVDAFQQNSFGLYNTAGNVWEWCFDWFHPTWHRASIRVNPTGPPSGTHRVIKGGSYLCHESYCKRYRNGSRTGCEPDTTSGHLGFRVAADI